MNFTKLGIAKFVAASVVGAGTGKIVGQLLKENVTTETKIDKITIGAAAWVIGAMATQATKNYTDSVIDQGVKAFQDLKQISDLAPKLGRINREESTFLKEGLDPVDFTTDNKGKWVVRQDENGSPIRVTIVKPA